MSAILAILHRTDEPLEPPALERMAVACSPSTCPSGREAGARRVWFNGRVALAHLDFVTPEALDEEPPLLAEDGWAITCDARLDNRDELAGALDLNPEARSLSDTGLILAAYRRWGVDCVPYLLGDFGFAVWDARRQHLFVATDPLGARAVCYYLDSRRAVVASEISAILAHPAVRPRLNEGKVAEFLANQWDDHDESYYQDIHYCPPAHCVLITADAVRQWRYWDIDPEKRLRFRTEAEAAAEYLHLLRQAVRSRLRAAGPVGISLSGGLDSTSLAAVASEELSGASSSAARLKSFSYTFDELVSCDERRYITPVVERFRLDATYLPCDDEWTLKDLPHWPVDRDFVLSDPYAWLPHAVMHAARQSGCKLLLAGHYGDVLWTGGLFWVLDLLHDRRLGQLARTLAGGQADRKRSPGSASVRAQGRHGTTFDARRDLVDFGLRPLIPRTMASRFRRWRPRRPEALHPGLHPDLAGRTDLSGRIERAQRWDDLPGPGQWARYRSLTLSAFSQGAAATRKLYHDHGLELAMPYWDRRLVEFVLALPAYELGGPGLDRPIPRLAMAGRLPQPVLERSERTTFTPLLRKGLQHKEQATVRRLLEQPQIVQRDMIRSQWLRAELDGSAAGRCDWDRLWPCLSLELWLRRYWPTETATLHPPGGKCELSVQ